MSVEVVISTVHFKGSSYLNSNNPLFGWLSKLGSLFGSLI